MQPLGNKIQCEKMLRACLKNCSRRRDRLCENSTFGGTLKKTTLPFDIWRVFIAGETSDDPFFEVPKCQFGVFTKSGEEAEGGVSTAKIPPPHVGGYRAWLFSKHALGNQPP
jgi:hypothetical protein